MAEIINSKTQELSLGSVSVMDEATLQNYLKEMRHTFASAGQDLSELGIEGLSNNTTFMNASLEQLRTWAEGL
jgi:hypothetical protein